MISTLLIKSIISVWFLMAEMVKSMDIPLQRTKNRVMIGVQTHPVMTRATGHCKEGETTP